MYVAMNIEDLIAQADEVLALGGLPQTDRNRQLFAMFIQHLEAPEFNPEDVVNNIKLGQAKQAAYVLISPQELQNYRESLKPKEPTNDQAPTETTPSEVDEAS